jgi:Domain of unknown function (DUF4349)
MTTNFKNRFFKISKWFGFLFVFLFVFRLLYGYVASDSNNAADFRGDFFGSIENLRKNYASEKVKFKGGGGDIQMQSNIASNQKFEKTASIKSKSSEFEQDEKTIKTQTKTYNAIIQYEQNVGQKGNREIHLLIGVNPELFDKFYVEIMKIGVVKTMEITKVDKTNEYRQLNAKKTSIEKTLTSLNELKSKGGQISDFVTLNDKILEIEGRLQELGVELGNFDTENEFCTVKLSLYEGATEKNISFIHRIKVALEWTIKYYAVLIFTALMLTLFSFLLLLVIDKMKVMNIINNTMNQ